MTYHHIRLSDHAILSGPGPLPYVIANWTDDYVADLTGKVDHAFGFDGTGYWPDVVTTPSFDATTQVVVPPASYAVDPTSKTVTGTATIRDMTPDEFTAANPVPDSVTNYQARAALLAIGSFTAVDSAVRGSGSADAIQAWDYANNFYRASPFIAALQGAAGMTSAQVDDLFRAAAKVP